MQIVSNEESVSMKCQILSPWENNYFKIWYDKTFTQSTCTFV